MLYAAEMLDDLKVPPGKSLEALKGDRIGQLQTRYDLESEKDHLGGTLDHIHPLQSA